MKLSRQFKRSKAGKRAARAVLVRYHAACLPARPSRNAKRRAHRSTRAAYEAKRLYLAAKGRFAPVRELAKKISAGFPTEEAAAL